MAFSVVCFCSGGTLGLQAAAHGAQVAPFSAVQNQRITHEVHRNVNNMKGSGTNKQSNNYLFSNKNIAHLEPAAKSFKHIHKGLSAALHNFVQ
jgi:hypothetical protein